MPHRRKTTRHVRSRPTKPMRNPVLHYFSRWMGRLSAVLLGFATLAGGYAVFSSRVSIDVKDPDASTYWQTRFSIKNESTLPLFHLRYLCWYQSLDIDGIHISDSTHGYSVSARTLSPLDSFDAVCKGERIESIGGSKPRIKLSNLEVVVGFKNIFHLWETIECANFVPTDVPPTIVRWERRAADLSQCRHVFRRQEKKFPKLFG